MYKLSIRRKLELKAPLDLCVEVNNDWTHFIHLHRQTVSAYHLLHKRGNREIFLYKAKRLHPFPWYDHYVVFRDYKPEQNGYCAVYFNVKTGHKHYLSARAEAQGDRTFLVSDYLFQLRSIWRFFPGLFFWVFKWRMRKLMEEDNGWISERLKMERPIQNEECAPVVPEAYDLFDNLFKEEILLTGEKFFEDHCVETFEGRTR